eukprot:760714-Hanusia_phi.AAC.1
MTMTKTIATTMVMIMRRRGVMACKEQEDWYSRDPMISSIIKMFRRGGGRAGEERRCTHVPGCHEAVFIPMWFACLHRV